MKSSAYLCGIREQFDRLLFLLQRLLAGGQDVAQLGHTGPEFTALAALGLKLSAQGSDLLRLRRALE